MNRYRRKYRDASVSEDWKKITKPGWSAGVKEALTGEINIGTDSDPDYVTMRSRIRLPAVSIQNIHNKDRTRHLVQKAIELLRETRFSRWQNEAPVRYGFRIGLVLSGYQWQRADDEAARIVRFAFNKLGRGKESRPTADEAREEYLIPAENCLVCYRLLDADQIGTTRFCSMEHAKFQYFRREYAERKHDSEFALAARKLVYKEQFGQAECPQCTKTFWRSYEGQIHCRPKCKAASQVIIYEPRECALDGCTTVFEPNYEDQRFCCQKHAASVTTRQARQCAREGCTNTFISSHNNETEGGRRGLYCSPACASADRGSRLYNLTCQCCGDPFTASMPNAAYCCEGHRQIVVKAERGQLPKRLSAGVFDWMFIMNAGESHSINDLFDRAA